MASKAQNQYDYNRRVCTEMHDNAHHEAYDINRLPDKVDPNLADDVDDIDFANYKGIYANDEHGQKYQCPETGAHFEFKDLCRRIHKIMESRKAMEEQIYGKQSK